MSQKYCFIREIDAQYRSKRYDAELKKLDNPVKVASLYREIYGVPSREKVAAFYLNNKNEVVGHYLIGAGSVSVSIVHPREVFQGALLANASGIVLSHNHPSGILTPSAEDIQTTKRIEDGCRIMGFTFIDHVIVTEGGYCSIREEGFV